MRSPFTIVKPIPQDLTLQPGQSHTFPNGVTVTLGEDGRVKVSGFGCPKCSDMGWIPAYIDPMMPCCDCEVGDFASGKVSEGEK